MDKSALQELNELCQRIFRGKIAQVTSETRQWSGENETDVELTLPDGKVFTATALNKKDAKQEAASEALSYMYDNY